MRRGIWVGAAILVAVAAAIPIWLVVDDAGERTQGALTQSPQSALDCSRATARGCPELNQLLATLDAELAGDQRAATIEATQSSIKQNSFYKTAEQGGLSQDMQFALQNALQRQAQIMAAQANISNAHQAVQQSLINNLRG